MAPTANNPTDVGSGTAAGKTSSNIVPALNWSNVAVAPPPLTGLLWNTNGSAAAMPSMPNGPPVSVAWTVAVPSSDASVPPADRKFANARLAADYLLERGFQRLAAIGIVGQRYAAARLAGFRRRADEAGASYVGHEVGVATVDPADPRGWSLEDDALRAFIGRLPSPPIGLFATNDGRAIQFVEAGRQVALDVPGDVAVVACDNDDLLCELARPPLTSVVPAAEKVGYGAAVALDRLLAGDGGVASRTLVQPVGVVTRQSSDVTAITEPDVAAALRYIRDNAHRPMSGDDVVRQVAVARRSLERRFSAHLGRTLHAEIERAHVDQAKQLLAHTDLPMPAVADRSRFGSLRTLAIVFRKATGLTPSAYRRRHRLR